MDTNDTTAMSARLATAPTAQAPFAYVLYTVNSFRITGQATVYAASAQDAVDQAIAMGYLKAEAAPAVPVNGFAEGLPVRHGDTASHDTRL